MRGCESPLYIYDREGLRYRAEATINDDEFVIWVYRRGVSIAHLFGTVEGTALHLNDIEVSDRAVETVATWRRLLRRPLKAYRRRGIGSALLRLAIELARERRLQLITGDVVQKDLHANPSLANWYTALGFSIIEKRLGAIQGSRFSIYMDL